MADERLRRLLREAALGDPEAQVRLLRERVRAGVLDDERMRLAAYLGDAASQEVLGDAAPAVPEDLEEWLGGLSEQSPEASIRARIAAARFVELPAFGEHTVVRVDVHSPAWVRALRAVSEQAEVRREIERALVSWILGYGDPVQGP